MEKSLHSEQINSSENIFFFQVLVFFQLFNFKISFEKLIGRYHKEMQFGVALKLTTVSRFVLRISHRNITQQVSRTGKTKIYL